MSTTRKDRPPEEEEERIMGITKSPVRDTTAVPPRLFSIV
jgi:hypothetical protein